jgi:hypothetical protein
MIIVMTQIYFILKHTPDFKKINWTLKETSIFETIFAIFKFYIMFLIPVLRWFLLYIFLFEDSISVELREKIHELYLEQEKENEENL